MDDHDILADARMDGEHPSRYRARFGSPGDDAPVKRWELNGVKAQIDGLRCRVARLEEQQAPVVSLGQGSFRRDITPRRLHRLLSVRRWVGWLRRGHT